MASDIDIVFLDRYTPIEKFEYYTQQYPAMSVLLLWLHAIDNILSTLEFKAPIYILDDETIYQLVTRDDRSLGQKQLEMAMIYLTQSQMIYRFTVALKFCINEKSIKQLRINSWGRKYCREQLLGQHQVLYQRILQQVASKFDVSKTLYMDALNCFKSIDVQHVSAEALKEINQHLDIKVVC